MSDYRSFDSRVIIVSKSQEHMLLSISMHALFTTPRLFEEMLRNSQAQALTVNNMEVKFSCLYFLKLFITKQQAKSSQRIQRKSAVKACTFRYTEI